MRHDGRQPDELRPITFERDYTECAGGLGARRASARTRVLCTASIDEDVPRWMRGNGQGLGDRRVLDAARLLARAHPTARRQGGKPTGRTQEIQRLIGRSLRAVCDMGLLGERQVIVDCDVLQADGGTRTASICGGYLALHDALTRLVAGRAHRRPPARPTSARPSPSASSTACRCSTCPTSRTPSAEVDMNVVMTGGGPLRRGAGHGRGRCRSAAASSTRCSASAEAGIGEIIDLQRESWPTPPAPRRRRETAAATAARRLVLATANPDKVAEIDGLLGDAGRAGAAAGRRARRGRGRRHARGQRPAEGAWRCVDGDGRAGGGRRHRPRGRRPRRRARRALGPLRRRRRRPTPTTWPSCSPSWRVGARRRPTAGRGSAPWRCCAGPTAARWWPRARSTARSPPARAGDGGFGYDPVFVPDEGDGRTFAEMTAGEARHQPPRPRLPPLAERARSPI